MKDLLNLLTNLSHLKDFDKICIGVASPQKIRSWSFGEIKTPETINYRTFKPEHEGLFCAKTFGPVTDYECLCGKYRLFKHQGIVCEKCGVEVTKTSVRRQRMGHIDLAAPVAHIWYLKSLPSRIGLLLDMSQRDLERVLYFDAYIVIEPGLSPLLKRGQLLSESAYIKALETFGPEIDIRMGGESIYELLRTTDLPALELSLQKQINASNSETIKKKLRKRLRLVQSFLETNTQPQWMTLKVLPVLPPDLRPLVPLDGGRFANSDLNELYRRVINRNNRTKRLLNLNAPEVVVRNELRLLQESVDALLDNGRRGRVFTGPNKLPLHSLSGMIKGKHGRFRQNLLGKRVDYSARSVIAVNPTLKLHQCGLPREMALELFKPFLFNYLQKSKLAISINAAKKLLEQRPPQIWQALEEVIHEHPILLNRAPTLARLNIQAFELLLVDGKAIQLHPLICKAFNANFDGDQMAVHVPLSIEAQLEAKILLRSDRNILSPANGEPLIVPSQEMVLGLYFMTSAQAGARGEGMIFADVSEVQRAYDNFIVELPAQIEVRINQNEYPVSLNDELEFSTEDNSECETIYNSQFTIHNSQLPLVKTTVGRAILSQCLPVGMPYEMINLTVTKQTLTKLINQCYYFYGVAKTVQFAQQLMQFGFTQVTRAGLSLNLDDIAIPESKKNLINEATARANDIQQQYLKGLLTNRQRYHKIIEIWQNTNDKIAEAVLATLSENRIQNNQFSSANRNQSGAQLPDIKIENTLHAMVNTQVQSLEKIQQLSGMRGLMTKPGGSILEKPITANFREGLDIHQYFISTVGTRKGLAERALKTANAGYLTRRLVDIAQDVIIARQDCGTTDGLSLTTLTVNGKIIETLGSRALGRIIAEDIFSQPHSKLIAKAGTLLDEVWIERLEQEKVESIKVRSPITCQSMHGVCVSCYGRDLARGELVNIGEAIGVMAAQSIGESGTQLTMRTPNGVPKCSIISSHIEAKTFGTVKFNHLKVIRQRLSRKQSKSILQSNLITITTGKLTILDDAGLEKESYNVPYGSNLLVNDGDRIEAKQWLAHWDPLMYPIISNVDGYVGFADIFEGVTVKCETDEITKHTAIIVKEPKERPLIARDMRPRLMLREVTCQENRDADQPVNYILPPRAIIEVKENAKVSRGNVIARLPINLPKNQDITSGLLRIIDLFEARIPKQAAILASATGIVSFGKETKTKYRIIITDEFGVPKREITIPKWRHLNVIAGQHLKLGDKIVEGEQNLHDILRLQGISELVKHIISEMQEIYTTHDISINDKHFEVIIRQMLQTITIIEPGHKPFRNGEIVKRISLTSELSSTQVEADNNPVIYEPKLLGITKASLTTESFISAASFMDTTRVLLSSAVNGQCDKLRGLKENVIIGRLIPAGTGLAAYHKEK